MTLIVRSARLIGVVWVVVVTAVAKIATGAPLSRLGYNVFPTVLLNLHHDETNNNATTTRATKCVTFNGRDLCTTITHCPREAYQCSYVDPQHGQHNCGLYSYQCACTATFGNETCHCDVIGHTPYRVSTRVAACSNNDQQIGHMRSDFFPDGTSVDCHDPVGYCYSSPTSWTIARAWQPTATALVTLAFWKFCTL